MTRNALTKTSNRNAVVARPFRSVLRAVEEITLSVNGTEMGQP